ncbi:MAG: amidase, partial [Gemmatimonadetes bacterium]|nr:amidase [Gemmatimonadota bacterium]
MSDESLSRRAFVGVSATIAAGVLTKGGEASSRRVDGMPSSERPAPATAPLDDLTITDLQEGLAAGRYTARSLVEQYQARIESMDKQGPTLNHVLELNPDALD